MTNIKTTSSVNKTLKVLFVMLAIFATTMAGTQTASASAPAPQAAAVQAAAPAAGDGVAVPYDVSCSAPTYYWNGVTRTCTVYSGYVRQYVTCSNGVTYYGPWVGVGSWYLYNYCPSPYSRTGSGRQFTG